MCGGAKISLEEMEEYRELVNWDLAQRENEWDVWVDGEQWAIPKVA